MENWQRIREIFVAARRQNPDSRSKFLDQACGTDENLRREVESLLSSYDGADSFLEDSPVSDLSLENETKQLKIGARFGHYEIVELIGTGGMGEVYLAEDKKLDRKVAIKILNEKFAKHESNLSRFIQEAKSASALNHPNILTIYEIGESEDAHYIVSEYIEGETLREVLNRKTLKLNEVLDIAIQIGTALVAAHIAKIIHRDIKPENIVVRPDGYAKILDFGLAKLVKQKAIGFEESTIKQNETAKGIILGTINYMSPEQAKGERVDERTDIFSFGVCLYEMLTGRTPFAGESVSETFANLINKDPQPLARFAMDMPDELQRIVSKTLKKNKDERYQTIKDLLSNLKSLQKQLEFDVELGRNLRRESVTRIVSAPATDSVAVLPFVNGSDDAELNYLSDGLSESVIDRLSQLSQLKVIARSSSFKYRGENLDLQDVADKLGVRVIVTGRVIQRNDNLSIRVEMVDAHDNRQMWSEQFDRRTADALNAQREIAQTVSEKLRLKLSGAQQRQLARQGTSNALAYDLLLRGDFFVNKGGIENKQKALEYYRQAIEIDPRYAIAYAKLSSVYRTLIGFSVLDPKEFTPKLRAATRKAIELDENLGDARLQLANSHLDEWNWTDAETEYQRAIELNPNLIDARRKYIVFLTVVGRYDEAFAEARWVEELDPLTLYTKLMIPYVQVSARRYDEAITEFEKMLELDPNFSSTYLFLGNAYTGKEMFREAVNAFLEAIRCGDNGPSVQIYLGTAYAGAGEREKAMDILRRLETSGQYVPPGELAILYVALGEVEKAYTSLEKAYTTRDLHLQYLKVEPGFDSLRADARFQNLLRRVGFPTDTAAGKKIMDESKTLAMQSKTDSLDDSSVQIPKTIPADGSTNRNRIFIAALIFLLATIVLGYYFLSAGKTASNAKKTLAVLPFVNAAQDPNAEYLSDGIAESVINRLSQLSNLRVMSRNSAFRFKKNQIDTKNIASQLGVENLVLGDIRQVGDRFVINVRLINANDDSTIWGNQYVKTSGDIIAVQNEIAQAVVENLRGKLSESEQKRLGKNYTANAEAYQLYLKGRFQVSKTTAEEVKTGIEHFQEAIRLDPNYALAYAGLADAYRTLPLGAEFSPTEFFPKAKESARKALEIDETLAEAHAVFGSVIFWYDWDWAAAEEHIRRALEYNPDSADARLSYAHLLSNLGRHAEALAEAKKARELDPLNVRINGLEAQFLLHAGHIDEAFERLQKTYELAPNFLGYYNISASAYIEKEMFAEAEAVARKGQKLHPNISMIFLGYALAKSGKHAEAEVIAEQAIKLSNERFVPAYNIAMTFNGLGETEKTLTWLEKGLDQRDPRMTFLKVEPKWNNLRSDSRFLEIIRRVGFDKTAENAAETNSKIYRQMSDSGRLNSIRERTRL